MRSRVRSAGPDLGSGGQTFYARAVPVKADVGDGSGHG